MILYRSFSSLLFQLSSMGIFTILVFTVCGQQERFILCYDDTTVQHQEVLIFTYYIKLEWKISLIIGIKNHRNSPVWQWRQDLIKKFFRSYYFRFNFEVNFLYNHLLYSHTFLCHTGRKKAIFFLCLSLDVLISIKFDFYSVEQNDNMNILQMCLEYDGWWW